jgi:hypothetical protein
MSPKRKLEQKWFDAVTPEIAQAVKSRATDGEIHCASARKLAEELDVKYQVIGAAADEAGLRIKNCSLGCF